MYELTFNKKLGSGLFSNIFEVISFEIEGFNNDDFSIEVIEGSSS